MDKKKKIMAGAGAAVIILAGAAFFLGGKGGNGGHGGPGGPGGMEQESTVTVVSAAHPTTGDISVTSSLTVLCGHSLAEAMLVNAATVVRLECSFHFLIILYYVITQEKWK